jgi:hypothetical protein
MGSAKALRFAIPTAAIAVLLAGAVPAGASSASYSGTFTDGGAVSFKAVARHGKIVRVKEFAWSDVPAKCPQGDRTYTAQLPYSLGVAARLFSMTASDGSLVQSVSGRFTNHRRRAQGSLSAYGIFGLGETNCSTGRLAWSAVRH